MLIPFLMLKHPFKGLVLVHVDPLVGWVVASLNNSTTLAFLNNDKDEVVGVVLHAALHLLFVGSVVFVLAVEPDQVLYFEIGGGNVDHLYVLLVDNDQRVAFTPILNAVLEFEHGADIFQHLPILALHAIHIAC